MRAMPFLSDTGHAAAELAAVSSNAKLGGKRSGQGQADFGEILANVTTGSAGVAVHSDNSQSSWRGSHAANLPPPRPFVPSSEQAQPKAGAVPKDALKEAHTESGIGAPQSASADSGASESQSRVPSTLGDESALSAPSANAGQDPSSAPSPRMTTSLYRLSIEVAAAGQQAETTQPSGNAPPHPTDAKADTAGLGVLVPQRPSAKASANPAAADNAEPPPATHERLKSADKHPARDSAGASGSDSVDSTKAAPPNMQSPASNPLTTAAFAPLGTFILTGPSTDSRRDAGEQVRSSRDPILANVADAKDGLASSQRDASGIDTKQALPAGTTTALTQMNAKVTSKETHLPPVVPLSPAYQIADAIISEASTFNSDPSSSAPAAADPLPLAALPMTRVMTLNLDPPDLGKVEITMRLTGGGLNIDIDVASGETLHRLHADEDKLAKALGSSGYDVGNLTIRAAVHDLSAATSQGNSATGQNPSSSSSPAPQSDQSGSSPDRGRSGQDSFADRSKNDSTGGRQSQNRDGAAVLNGDDALYV